jgi:Cu/Ag efflux protein CusF
MKIGLVAGSVVLALAGIGGGVAFAAGGSTPPVATPAASATHHKARPARRAEHGELTVRAGKGTQVVDVQRGQVTAVSATSVTVRSKDGFSATYVVGSSSKVRAAKKAASISAVRTGDRVGVVAVRSGGVVTVRRLADPHP